MNKLILHLIYIILLTAIALASGSCDHNRAIRHELDRAERLMNSAPDSALALLDSIPAANIRGSETAARYALLKSIALDKNYIDTTTFDVLQPAIDYYLTDGTPDEQLRTYYYQGRIYQNKGDFDNAMSSFMKGIDLQQQITDSITLAHTLVAQGAMYFREYKIEDYSRNNIKAAKLYGAIGRDYFEISSYAKAINGYIILGNKNIADSILTIAEQLLKRIPDANVELFPARLSYTIEFCSSEDIKIFLDKYNDIELTNNEIIDFAQGYSKIGEYEKAMSLISRINPDTTILDSLKYSSVKIDILEKQGLYQQSLELYKEYSIILERYQKQLLSIDLLFSDKKHHFEINSLKEKQLTERIIWSTGIGIFLLIIFAVWLCFRNYISKSKRILAEKENENLRLKHDNILKEKEKAELQANYLKSEITDLENERDNLKEILSKRIELAKPLQNVLKKRLDMLNGLFAKEITKNHNYAKSYNKLVETLHNDKQQFMDSTRLAFKASHPQLMEYFENHGLSIDEINYLCLYAIGLRGKEVGEYIQLKRHYHISSDIRKKLGIDEHNTNLGIYIRKLLQEL